MLHREQTFLAGGSKQGRLSLAEKCKRLLVVLSGLIVWCTICWGHPFPNCMKNKCSEALCSTKPLKFKETGLEQPQPEIQEALCRIKLWDEWAGPQAPEPPINSEGTQAESNCFDKTGK